MCVCVRACEWVGGSGGLSRLALTALCLKRLCRAVKCVCEIGVPIIRKKRRKRILAWKPRKISEYHQCLNNSIRDRDDVSADNLQQIIADDAD